jgi:plasmid stabilization system protein ParE
VKPLRFHRAAQAEIKVAAEHYAAIHPELGRQFYDAVDQMVAEIREQPTLFRMFDPPARRHFGPRFPYAIIFVDLSDRVWVVAVMHFRQRPGYWVERIT